MKFASSFSLSGFSPSTATYCSDNFENWIYYFLVGASEFLEPIIFRRAWTWAYIGWVLGWGGGGTVASNSWWGGVPATVNTEKLYWLLWAELLAQNCPDKKCAKSLLPTTPIILLISLWWGGYSRLPRMSNFVNVKGNWSWFLASLVQRLIGFWLCQAAAVKARYQR